MCDTSEDPISCPNCEEAQMEYDPDMEVWICPHCEYQEDRN